MAKDFRTNNFAYSDTLFVGTRGCGSTFRSLLKFNLQYLPKSSVVCTASLNMFIARSDFASDCRFIDIHRLTEHFAEKKITWKDRPRFSRQVESSTEITSEIGDCAQWDISELVRDWQRGNVKNMGIMLKARDESCVNLLAFHSNYSPHPERRPKLDIILLEPTGAEPVRGKKFNSNLERSLLVKDNFQYSQVYDLSTVYDHSFFIHNKGAHPVSVVAQISPDNLQPNWLNDSPVSIINSGENCIITTNHLAKWVRLAFASVNPGQHSLLDIWFQSAT